MVKPFCSIIISLCFIFSCTRNNNETISITIMQTSDIHGAVFSNREDSSSMMQLSTLLSNERKKTKNLILLDNGDILQGNPAVYYYNYITTSKKHIVPEVMNYLTYDAATLGNHDIETGSEIYDKINKQLNFPWLAANIIDKQTGKPYFKPYTIITRSSLRIAVIGLVTNGIKNSIPEYFYKDMIFQPLVSAANQWIKHIADHEKPDAIIGLFHVGDIHCPVEKEKFCSSKNTLQHLIAHTAGFDLIFAGHDHVVKQKYYTDKKGKKIFVLAPQPYMQQVAKAKITFRRSANEKPWKKSVSGTLLNISPYQKDAAFAKRFKTHNQLVSQFEQSVIGYNNQYINTHESLFGTSSAVDLIHQLQHQISHAQISLAAPLTIDTAIDKGIFRMHHLFSLFPYKNLVYTIKLSGREIASLLEYTYGLWINTVLSRKQMLLKINKSYMNNKACHRLKTTFYNYISASGLQYEVDVRQPAGKRVSIISLEDGTTFSTDHHYTVALNSYHASGGGDVLQHAGISKKEFQKRIVEISPYDMRHYVRSYIKQHKYLNITSKNNWKFIPEKLISHRKSVETAIILQ